MWTSIERVEKPDTFEQACAFANESGSAILGGGSYIASKKAKSVSVLVDINHLVNDEVKKDSGAISLGARVSLQQLVDMKDDKISEWAERSCFSKNIRNQRTLGGEIAEGRKDSFFYAAMYALNPILHVYTPKLQEVQLRDWSGEGILSKVVIDASLVSKVSEKSYQVLSSAAPFLLVFAFEDTQKWEFVVAGKINKLVVTSCLHQEEYRESIEKMANEVAESFFSDHHGSVDYKRNLTKISMQRLLKKS